MRRASRFLVGTGVGLYLLALSLGALRTPGPWEREISLFEAEHRARRSPSGGIVFYGSSSIQGWTNLAECFPECPVVNRGFGGSEASDLVENFHRAVVPLAPRVLVLYTGANDVVGGKSPARVCADVRRLLELAHERLPQTRVAILSIKPSPSRIRFRDVEVEVEANNLLRGLARDRTHVEFIDVGSSLLNKEGQPDARFFLPDQLHLSGDGYRAWTDVLRPHVARWN